jgi:dolichol-phosphate mannosyltransferase
MTRSLIFFATYNEAGNVGPLLTAIVEAVPDADILVVDDSSTDGTIEEIAAKNLSNVTTLVRKGKLGLGTAHLLALAYARHHAYDIVATMDGDLSHDPAFLPTLMSEIDQGSDLSIGSRYMPGGSCDYTGYRLHISKMANIAAHLLLRIKLHEFTTSFRAFRVSAVQRIDFAALLVGGYSFFLTTVAEASRRGLRITEIPIHFRERGYGTSKIPTFEVFRGMANLMRIAMHKILHTDPLDSPAKLSACPRCGTTYSYVHAHEDTQTADSAGTCVFCGFHRS